MGGKGGSSGPSQQQINEQAYGAGASGMKWVDITGQIPYGHDQALQSWLAGQKSSKPAPMFEFPEFEMPSGGGEDSSATYEKRLSEQRAYQEQQYAKQQAELERQRQENLRIEGENRRDALYANYMDAMGSATDFVNAEIDKEMANARLLGIDYNIDDEMKSARISDYFATVWGEGEQAELEGLFSKWGPVKGFSGEWQKRGDGSKYAADTGPASETVVSTSAPLRPTPLDEEETLEAGANVLGV